MLVNAMTKEMGRYNGEEEVKWKEYGGGEKGGNRGNGGGGSRGGERRREERGETSQFFAF